MPSALSEGESALHWRAASAEVEAALLERMALAEARLAHLEALEPVRDTFGVSCGVRHLLVRKQTVDVTATSVFTITTTNETGDNDGGAYSCFVFANIGHATAPTAAYVASKAFMAEFTRAQRNNGTGTNSAVTETVETASAATSSPNRDIGTVTMTVLETSEYVQDVQFYVQCTGTSGTNPFVTAWVVLIYSAFTTPPTLAAA